MGDVKKPRGNFFKEVKAEMKKVIWPNGKDLRKHTIVVIASIILVGLVVALLDLLFGKGVSLLIG
jgi:preprotein translocase subunit SecE